MKHKENIILNFPKKISKYFFIDNCINHQSTFIKKKLFEKYGYYDESYEILADYEKWICFKKNKVCFKKISLVVSNFKNFDGLSSGEKTRDLMQKEKRAVVKKNFNILELGFFKILRLCGVISCKLLSYTKSFLRKIRFIFFSPKEFMGKYWHILLNNPLRKPARKVWYFLKNEKLKK